MVPRESKPPRLYGKIETGAIYNARNGGENVMAQYNHTAIEKKWRENWEKNPINVNDGKKEKYYYPFTQQSRDNNF